MIQKERIQEQNTRQVRKGRYVLYWMQAAQREEYNHALEYAVDRANELKQPLVVFFGLTDDYPSANERHYRFLLEGLKETGSALEKRGIRFIVRMTPPPEGVVELAREASLVVTDRDYVRVTRQWRRKAAGSLQCPLTRVETNLIVPASEASGKEEYSAATIRTKIRRKLPYFAVPLKRRTLHYPSMKLKLKSIDLSNIDRIISKMNIDRSVSPVPDFHGGISHSLKRLQTFLNNKIHDYDRDRNDPAKDVSSQLSPYLHFGQISPLKIALEVMRMESPGAAPFLEQMIVRRELAHNFTLYNPHYDSFECLNSWALETLQKHSADKRPYVYSREQLERALTHDPYWNAAQEEMILTGKMQGYMRMYWGKKILEWTPSPEQAFQTALYLNNKYELDGRDPNGFTGVAWCFGKHDRPWFERPVFGKIRYMNANGLKRKFKIDRYVEKIDRIKGERGK